MHGGCFLTSKIILATSLLSRAPTLTYGSQLQHRATPVSLDEKGFDFARDRRRHIAVDQELRW